MDSELVQLAKAGNQDAFSVLYARYLPFVRSVVGRTMTSQKEEVDDVTQQSLSLAFMRIAQFNDTARFSTWLYSIAVNKALETIRSAKRKPLTCATGLTIETDEGARIAFDIPCKGRPLQSFEAAEDLEKVWPHLKPRQQSYLYLHYIERMKINDIADRYDVAVGTVKCTMYRGLRAARTLMDHKPPSPSIEAKEILCDYCQGPTQWLPDTAVYSQSYGGMVYVCLTCKAWVGCHRRKDGQPGNYPLGRLANAELRRLKIRGHALFDRFWRAAIELRGWSKKRARASAYKWLSSETGIPPEKMHFGMLDNQECAKAIAVLEAFYAKIAAKKGGADGTHNDTA